MTRAAIQLYTLRDLNEPIPTSLDRIAQTPLDGVEFAGLNGSDVEDVETSLAENGLTAVGAHVDIDRIESEYDDVTETYRKLGCSRLVVPSYDSSAFRSEGDVKDAAKRLSVLGDRLEADGFELSYHNHTVEFTDLDTASAFDIFVKHLSPSVTLELDTGLAKHAGVDPVELLDRYGNRTPLVHLTDTVPGTDNTRHVELGAGELDLESCVETAKGVGAEWLIYEHGRTSDPVDSLAHAATKVNQLSERIEAKRV